MRGDELTTGVTLIVEECYRCAVKFAMPRGLKNQRLQDHESFFCPNGHGQIYTAKSDAEKLKEAEERIAMLRDENLAAWDAYNEEAQSRKTLEKRIAAGVCPCCHRHFQQLARHMKGKHPDYSSKAKLTALRGAKKPESGEKADRKAG